MSIGPSEYGSTSPFLVDMKSSECQIDIITVNQLAVKDAEIFELKKQLAAGLKRGDELEQKLTQSHSKAAQSDALKKLKFDN